MRRSRPCWRQRTASPRRGLRRWLSLPPGWSPPGRNALCGGSDGIRLCLAAPFRVSFSFWAAFPVALSARLGRCIAPCLSRRPSGRVLGAFSGHPLGSLLPGFRCRFLFRSCALHVSSFSAIAKANSRSGVLPDIGSRAQKRYHTPRFVRMYRSLDFARENKRTIELIADFRSRQ